MRAFDGEGGLLELARSYKRFGLHLQPNGDITYKEWAPSAKALSIVSILPAHQVAVWRLQWLEQRIVSMLAGLVRGVDDHVEGKARWHTADQAWRTV